MKIEQLILPFAFVLAYNASAQAPVLGANPYLPLWEHVPDGEPRVFEDPDNPGQFRVYVVGSHDTRLSSYCGNDIRQWSAPVTDLTNWTDEGAIFTYNVGDEFDVMYAPDLVEIRKKDGTKEYWLYPHSRGPRREAMVTKGLRPDGPFTPVNLTADGTATTEGSILGFDPAVFIDYITDPNDPDYERGYRVYGYWGFQGSNAAELDPETMCTVRPGTEIIHNFLPASTPEGSLRVPEDTQFTAIAKGEDPKSFRFFEASSIRKIGNKYVMIYSGYSGPEYGMPSSNSTLRYAYADTPLGPWKSGGVVVDSRAPMPSADGNSLISTNGGHNTHGSIQEINGKWYVFYHRPPRNFGFARQAMVAPINVSYDETPVAEGGKVTITGWTADTIDGIYRVSDKHGNTYTGADVTSEGFTTEGLDPYKFYSGGYACYLSNTGVMQDSYDVWDSHMPLTGLKNGDVVGYKYFIFGKDSKVKVKDSAIDIYLEPRTRRGFDIEVWIDAPGKGNGLQGALAGVVNVPIGASDGKYSVRLPNLNQLQGKHAVYLIMKGPEGKTLCDIEGIAFSNDKIHPTRFIAPRVFVEIDGKEYELQNNPVPYDQKSGLTDTGIYAIELPLDSSLSNHSVKAFATGNDVHVNVENLTNTGCDVKGEYMGIPKTWHISFK